MCIGLASAYPRIDSSGVTGAWLGATPGAPQQLHDVVLLLRPQRIIVPVPASEKYLRHCSLET